MSNKLIFIRHGVRGIKQIGNTLPDCLPFYNMDRNLSLFGHVYSYKQGQFIKDNFGQSDFIYGDITDERTIATAIAIAKGNNKERIWLYQGIKDPYFKHRHNVTAKSLKLSRRILRDNQNLIQEIGKAVKKKLPCIDLSQTSHINENGKTEGLIDQLGTLAQVATFSILSKIKTPLIKINQLIQEAYTINYLIENPIVETIQEAAENLLNGIFFLLSNNQLSILIGHNTNISSISQYLNLPYQVDNHCEFYIPPNSGFIFTMEQTFITIEKLYINMDGEFQIMKYMILPLPKNIVDPEWDLISRLV